MKTKSHELIMQNKVFLWIGAVTVLILSVPLIAMQFTEEVDWDSTDFIIMGALLFGIGSLFIVAARKTCNKMHRLAIGTAFFLVLLYIWAELAVGIFTNLGS